MDLVRGFVGFIMGIVVMGAIAFTGALDGIPHWWARNVTHRGDNNYDFDPEHARYTVSAIYQPAGNGEGNCEPRYAFVNHTNRAVKFLPDGYDDSAYGNQGAYNSQLPNSGYVSTTPNDGPPPNSGPQQGYDTQNSGPSNYDQQTYGPQSSDRQGYGSQGYGNAGYDSGQYDNGYSGDDQYDDDYPGEAGSGSCNPGVVEIILDRKK